MNAQICQKVINLVTAGMLLASSASPVLAAEAASNASRMPAGHTITQPANWATGGESNRGGPNRDKPGPSKPEGGNHGGQNRGPGQTGGVGLGGPGGGGPAGPGQPETTGNFGSAGFGGRGGGGGLSGVGPSGNPRPGMGNQPGQPGNAGRPNLGEIGLGGGIGRNQTGGIGQQNGQPGRPGVGIGRPGANTGAGPVNVPPFLGQDNRPPSVLDNLEPGAQAQQAIETAAEQGSDTAEQAIEAAQQAYETMWADYYEAVDYAAEAYYDAVTGVIDYGADTAEDYYNAAVEQSQEVVDDYYDLYDAYLDYMAMYPWDSYAYVYNEAAQTYESQEPVNVYYYNYTYGQTATVTESIPVTTTGAMTAVLPAITAQRPAPSAEAYEALVVFANDQLGTAVEPLYAGEITQEVLNLLATLPSQVQNPAYAATNIDAAGYYGLLKGGAAALAVGECPAGQTCPVGADLPAELSQAALGVYALATPEAMPASAAEALQLASLVYPKLTGLQFTQLADAQGYTFMAQTSSVAVQDGQPVVVAKVVLTGVVNVNGKTVVFAAVGLGETYSALLNPFNG